MWNCYTISKSLYRINHTLVHRLTVYATKETQTKSLCYNFNQKWYYLLKCEHISGLYYNDPLTQQRTIAHDRLDKADA